ncbi:MAG: peptide deformylase [Bacteroidia bacterium]
MEAEIAGTKKVLPIVAFGDPVLKKRAADVPEDYQGLPELIANMYETMYRAAGVGLAAPQVGLSLRLFITDGAAFEDEEVKQFKKVFINPEIVEEKEDKWGFEEGCLSIPGIRENINRHRTIKVKYRDENFKQQEEEFSGLAARIIQHEYDHIEGILFTDRISPLKKRILKKRLMDISKGNVDVEYRMKFPLK